MAQVLLEKMADRAFLANSSAFMTLGTHLMNRFPNESQTRIQYLDDRWCRFIRPLVSDLSDDAFAEFYEDES